MTSWLLAGVISVGALVTVLAAIAYGRPAPSGRPPEPAWALPRPSDLSPADIPIVFQGYDPTHVDTLLAAAAGAFAVLLEEAGPDARDRAARRLRAHRPASSGEELEDGGGDGPRVLHW